MVCSLEAGRVEVSPVKPCEVEWVHGANEHMLSLRGIETLGSFGLTQAPSTNVPECVLERVSDANDMVCMSACVELGHGPIQSGDVGRVTDGNGEPNGPLGTILEIAPASRDARSGSPGRHSRSRLCCKPRGAVRV